MDERVSVTLGGPTGVVARVDGPTPIDAPFLASQLAATLLDRVRGPVEPDSALRFAFAIPVMLSFSFDLEAPMVVRAAELGVPLTFRIETGTEPWHRTGRPVWDVGLEIWTGDRDPHLLTPQLGVAPDAAYRKGDPLEPTGKRRCRRGVWRLEANGAPGVAVDRVAQELVARLPATLPGWDEIRAEYAPKFRLSITAASLTGRFALPAELVAALAGYRIPIGVFFYNLGA